MPSPQFRYFLLTVPQHLFVPWQPNGVGWIRGQLERGNGTGFLHWQLAVHFTKKTTLAGVKNVFGQETHVEPTRSEAADGYVWKEETRIEGTQFELGERRTKGIKRRIDWDAAFESAKRGSFDDVAGDLRFRYFHSMQRIHAYYAIGVGVVRSTVVYWGPTGTGKSRRAWDEAGILGYPKSPTSKFWDGYTDQKHVVIDEFRGNIEISHMLRWLDRYPVLVEIKGSSVPLHAERIWITSNLHPNEWYPTVDNITREALIRRLEIVHMT
jgi:hypothetical protein